MRYVRPLTEARKEDLALVGGKAAGLGELLRAGFPVPPGFCVTSLAYEAFVQHNGLERAVREALALGDLSGLEQAERASGAIRAAMEASPVPPDVEEAVRNALEALGPGPVSVRSSATAEDLPEASFAGQYDTYLNVHGLEEVLRCIRGCWASLWSPRAVQYRHRQGYDHRRVRMAVVVQRLIPAQVSGVMLTVNPISGDRGQMVISATYGLGEALVSGAVTPDSFTVAKDSLAVVSNQVGAKEVMATPAANGGTVTTMVGEEMRGQPCLTHQHLAQLAELGKRVEAHWGWPQDIEWALADGQPYLLQSRALTALPPQQPSVSWESPVPGARWRRNWRIGEWLSDPVTPLFATLLLPVLVAGREEQGFNHLGWNTPKTFAMPQPWFCIVNGYFFTRADYPNTGQPMDIVSRARRMHQRTQWYREWYSTHMPAYFQRLKGFQGLDLRRAKAGELVSLLEELARDAGEWWYLLAPIGLGFEEMVFAPLYEEYFGGKDGPHYAVLFSGFDTPLLEGQRRLYRLAQELKGKEALRSLFLEAEPQQVLERLGATTGGAEFLEELRGYWREFGHQVFSFDFYFPTLGERPEATIQVLQSYLRQEPPDPQVILSQQARQREEATREVVERVRRSGSPYVEEFLMALEWHQLCAGIREEISFHMQRLWPLMRAAVLELGRRMKEAGALDSAQQVFFLEKEELREAALALDHGRGLDPGLRGRAGARLESWRRQGELMPPDRIPPSTDPAWRGSNLLSTGRGLQVRRGRPVLVGQAASPGRATGPARILRSAADFKALEGGEVLVTVVTNPAWTPLFALASAVVTEIGGGATHCSMVAREYGIPAVMGTGIATQVIRDGQLITVDGTQGVVYLEPV